MDKREKKTAGITIKINGDKKDFQEDIPVHNWKLGEQESAAAEERAEDDSFEWVLPDEDPVPKEFKKINYVQKNKKKGKRNYSGGGITPGIARIIYTLVGAVALSLIFGSIILNVITEGEQSAPAIKLQEPGSANAGEAASPSEGGGSISLKSINASVLQGGYFSTADSANTMKSSIEAKGLPVIQIEMEGSQYLFVGTAGDLESAKAMGKKLTEQNIEVYAKDIVLPEKQVEGSKADADFLEKSASLYSAVAAESSSAYTTGSVNDEKLDEINTLLKDITAIKTSESMKGLQEKLGAAALNLQEYKSSSELAKLVASQQSLLSYLEAYHNL
ncbi:hypothetical protein FZC84_05335 [Rossellomorea vietnamensis]|uniref:SPOR domain-containing protein n=1 Tax=Rossellomorea vietnamensis TaxID=218284 RepID=A0A5D4MHW5_9BACI|nr:hypothetical protein [Rossellomorea vietnamensis]TYS00914.1 hypothetical protein FZC84_05335 [Rossellomorea vietnamensis]